MSPVGKQRVSLKRGKGVASSDEGSSTGPKRPKTSSDSGDAGGPGAPSDGALASLYPGDRVEASCLRERRVKWDRRDAPSSASCWLPESACASGYSKAYAWMPVEPFDPASGRVLSAGPRMNFTPRDKWPVLSARDFFRVHCLTTRTRSGAPWTESTPLEDCYMFYAVPFPCVPLPEKGAPTRLRLEGAREDGCAPNLLQLEQYGGDYDSDEETVLAEQSLLRRTSVRRRGLRRALLERAELRGDMYRVIPRAQLRLKSAREGRLHERACASSGLEWDWERSEEEPRAGFLEALEKVRGSTECVLTGERAAPDWLRALERVASSAPSSPSSPSSPPSADEELGACVLLEPEVGQAAFHLLHELAWFRSQRREWQRGKKEEDDEDEKGDCAGDAGAFAGVRGRWPLSGVLTAYERLRVPCVSDGEGNGEGEGNSGEEGGCPEDGDEEGYRWLSVGGAERGSALWHRRRERQRSEKTAERVSVLGALMYSMGLQCVFETTSLSVMDGLAAQLVADVGLWRARALLQSLRWSGASNGTACEMESGRDEMAGERAVQECFAQRARLEECVKAREKRERERERRFEERMSASGSEEDTLASDVYGCDSVVCADLPRRRLLTALLVRERSGWLREFGADEIECAREWLAGEGGDFARELRARVQAAQGNGEWTYSPSSGEVVYRERALTAVSRSRFPTLGEGRAWCLRAAGDTAALLVQTGGDSGERARCVRLVVFRGAAEERGEERGSGALRMSLRVLLDATVGPDAGLGGTSVSAECVRDSSMLLGWCERGGEMGGALLKELREGAYRGDPYSAGGLLLRANGRYFAVRSGAMGEGVRELPGHVCASLPKCGVTENFGSAGAHGPGCASSCDWRSAHSVEVLPESGATALAKGGRCGALRTALDYECAWRDQLWTEESLVLLSAAARRDV